MFFLLFIGCCRSLDLDLNLKSQITTNKLRTILSTSKWIGKKVPSSSMLWMQNWWFFRIVSFRSIPSSFIYLSSYSSWRIRWFLCIFIFNLVFGEGKKAYNYRIKCLFYYWRKWWNNYMVKCDQQEKIPLVIPDEWKWKCIIKHNIHTHTLAQTLNYDEI